jgi:outer membrane protein TolC
MMPVVILVGLSCRSGWSQMPEKPLTLQEAVRMALARNPEVLVAQDQLDEVKGKIREVRAGAFPQLSMEGMGVRMRDPSFLNSPSFDKVPEEFRNALQITSSNLFDVALDVKQPLYTAGKVRNAIRLAQEAVEEKEANLETARQRVTYKVFQGFHDILLAEEDLALVRETYDQRQKHLEMARNRFAQGVATEIDVLRSQVNLANMEPNRIRADNRVRLARAALNNLIVLDLDVPVRVEGKLQHRPWMIASIAEIQERAQEVRPELTVARRQLDEARLLLALARAENKPSVDFDGRFGYSTRDPRNQFDYQFSRWSLTVNFRLTFYDSGRKSGLVDQAASRVQIAEHNLAQLQNNVRLEIKEAYDVLQSSAEAIAAARVNVSEAERVLSMMQANYEYGAATTLDVVDSQTALTVARNAQMNATYLYEIAKARLRLAAGSPILDEETRQ